MIKFFSVMFLFIVCSAEAAETQDVFTSLAIQQPMTSATDPSKKMSGKILKIIKGDNCFYYLIKSKDRKVWVSKCAIDNPNILEGSVNTESKITNFMKVGDKVIIEYSDFFFRRGVFIKEIDIYAENFIPLVDIGKVE